MKDYNVYAMCFDKEHVFFLEIWKVIFRPDYLVQFIMLFYYIKFFFWSLLISATKFYVDKYRLTWKKKKKHFFSVIKVNEVTRKAIYTAVVKYKWNDR